MVWTAGAGTGILEAATSYTTSCHRRFVDDGVSVAVDFDEEHDKSKLYRLSLFVPRLRPPLTRLKTRQPQQSSGNGAV